jgi:hypothetical protein
MWAGFSLAAVYNLVNIAHALSPSFPAFGKEVDLTTLFTTPPWSEIAPLHFHFRPELVGLGYLVSTEISLTVWLSFWLMKPPGKRTEELFSRISSRFAEVKCYYQ